jgi:hypothetical protein
VVLRWFVNTETIRIDKRLLGVVGRRKKMDIRQIVSELKKERDRIDRAIASLQGGSSNGRSRKTAPAKPAARKGGITASGRKALSEAMKRRWAERRAKSAKVTGPKVASAKPAKKRGGMSAAGRKRISEMMKKRWAERRRKAS